MYHLSLWKVQLNIMIGNCARLLPLLKFECLLHDSMTGNIFVIVITRCVDYRTFSLIFVHQEILSLLHKTPGTKNRHHRTVSPKLSDLNHRRDIVIYFRPKHSYMPGVYVIRPHRVMCFYIFFVKCEEFRCFHKHCI